MRAIEKRIKEFYRKHDMDHEDLDIEKECGLFIEDMEKGLRGGESSLPMIPTYIEVDGNIPVNKRVIVLDAGGTNFRVATIYFTEQYRAVIENFSTYTMPGSDRRVSKEEFFKLIAEYTSPVIKRSSNIGFCFSYPTEALPGKNGRLLYMSKEIQAKEIEGEVIGENMLAALTEMGHTDKKHVVLLNDTVATLLAGKAGHGSRIFSSYIGFILGTGSNCCYIEKNKNIKKLKDLNQKKSQVINAESGAFGKAKRGDIDQRFDSMMVNPGVHTFEKMISGRYLGPLCGVIVGVAIEEGLFSKKSRKVSKGLETVTTEDLNDFMNNPMSNTGNLVRFAGLNSEEDRVSLYHIIDRLVERAAKLTAIHLSSFLIKTGEGNNPCFPVCITAEGTVFYGLKSFKEKVEYYLKDYLQGKKKLYYEIVHIENATLIGAAVAGLTN
ncbi:MAG: hexokinase [Spirochaetota bacterium]|nr:MAG: hexokinase [Spirochaetota bacterium]